MLISSSLISFGTAVQGVVAAVCGVIIAALGGWDDLLFILLLCMLGDIITGVYTSLIGRSRNSPNGYYKSTVFGKGILKKVLILVIVSLSVGVDMVMKTDCLRDMTVMFFLIGEAISIIENAECAGVPIPNKLRTMLEVYHEDVSSREDKEHLRDVLPDKLTPNDRITKKEDEGKPSDCTETPLKRTSGRP